MKKSSLLALSLVSLVSLVGCGKSGSKPSASKAIFNEFVVDLLGDEGKDFINKMTLEEAQQFMGTEKATEGYYLGVTFAASETLSAEILFTDMFVGTEDDEAYFAPFEEKYADDYFVVNPFAYDDENQEYVGSFVYNGASNRQIYFQLSIADVEEADPETTEPVNSVELWAFAVALKYSKDFKAAQTLFGSSLFEEFGPVNTLFAPIEATLPSWASEGAVSEQCAILELEAGTTTAQVLAKYFEERENPEDPESPLPSLWSEFEVANGVGSDYDTPYTAESGYGSYLKFISVTDSKAEYVSYYFQYIDSAAYFVVLVSHIVEEF